uniref:Uncharacterized protein n=1 Tax=Populus trichocarpa TaxID=3694 RepID=A0A3N7FHT8_POPTR
MKASNRKTCKIDKSPHTQKKKTQKIALQKLVNLFCLSNGLGLAFPSFSFSLHHFYPPIFIDIFSI